MTGTETYSFGEWLKQRRAALRLTQRELAAAVHCSVPMLKKIESDERRPSPELARLLAGALQVPPADQEAFVAAARGERSVDALWPIQAGSAPTDWQAYAPAPLPPSATAFIGREAELKEIAERLAQPDCRLLTLVGLGGMGKTRLALRAAEAYWPAANAPDGDAAKEGQPVVFVPLTSVTEAADIPEAVARALRLNLSGPPEEQVLSFLRRRRVLLVLDNCEQIEGDLGWLSELLARAPQVKLLATSRQRLNLAEEYVYAVPGLAQAEALFGERARRAKRDFDEDAERPDIRRICELVEYLPLAVELAAGWTPLMTCAQIAAHLAQDLALLATDLRNVPERHRSLQAVCDHSWALLTAPEQNALMRLSVFRGGWLAEEAQAVAGADLPLLRRLVDKSMVRVGERGRFDLHEVIRQDAERRLAQTGNTVETQRRHLEASWALAARLDAEQIGPEAMAAVARFDHEQANLRAALEWGLETGAAEPVLGLLYHLWFYWARRGAYREGSEWSRRALALAGDRENVPVCLALCTAAVFGFIQGQFAEAQALAQKALPMAQRLEEPEALITAYGMATFASVTLEQALAGLQTAIQLSEATGKSRELRPLLYNGAATWLHSSGRYAEARAYFEKSVALFTELGAVDFISEPLGQLGQLALQEGRLQEAHEFTLRSLAAARASGYDVVYGAWGGARLGQIQLYQGDVEAAQRSLEAALAYLEDDPAYARTRQETLALLSEAALVQGDVPAAEAHMRASLALCEQFYRELEAAQKLEGTADSLPVDLIGLCGRAGLLAAAQDQPQRAALLYGAAQTLEAQSGQAMLPPLRARVDESLAGLRAQLGEAAFEAAWAAGQRLSTAEAYAVLLDSGRAAPLAPQQPGSR